MPSIEVPIFTYNEQETIDLYQFSISDKYYEYLQALFANSEWVGLLSDLPGDLPTNASEGALGYFWATDIRKKSYTVDEVVKK